MATAKTSSTKAAAAPAEARPFAESPAPEHVRIDTGSIACEEIKQKALGPSQPVFSTMALAHGASAAGASTLKPGFSWNPRMDLLWALGYPDVLLIVDGFPTEDTKQGILGYWNAEQHEFRWWRDRAASGNPRVISRRGAFAELHELATDQNPFELADDEFLRVTEPRSLSEAEATALLRKIDTAALIARASLLLEALVGPSCVAEALCLMAEDTTIEGRRAYRGMATSALRPLLRRVPVAERDAILNRLGKIALVPGGDPDPSYMQATLDPLAAANATVARGKAPYALGPLQWVDGQEDLILECYDARPKVPNVPTPRLSFVGGDRLIEREVANFEKYSDGVDAYFHDYSTIRHATMLQPALKLLSKKAFREGVAQWLHSHAEAVRPVLQELAKDPEHERAAQAALKQLG